MYIKIGDNNYNCSDFSATDEEYSFYLDEIPEEITDTLRMYSNDEEPICLLTLDTLEYSHTVVPSVYDSNKYLLFFTKSETSAEGTIILRRKEEKVRELDQACTQIIYDGTIVTLSDSSTAQFTLHENDQLNLSGIGLELLMGAQTVSWHADDESEHCKYYSATDAQLIIGTLTLFKKYHITYFRDLRIYVRGLTSVTDIDAIAYGSPIPQEFKSQVLIDLESQMNPVTPEE